MERLFLGVEIRSWNLNFDSWESNFGFWKSNFVPKCQILALGSQILLLDFIFSPFSARGRPKPLRTVLQLRHRSRSNQPSTSIRQKANQHHRRGEAVGRGGDKILQKNRSTKRRRSLKRVASRLEITNKAQMDGRLHFQERADENFRFGRCARLDDFAGSILDFLGDFEV